MQVSFLVLPRTSIPNGFHGRNHRRLGFARKGSSAEHPWIEKTSPFHLHTSGTTCFLPKHLSKHVTKHYLRNEKRGWRFMYELHLHILMSKPDLANHMQWSSCSLEWWPWCRFPTIFRFLAADIALNKLWRSFVLTETQVRRASRSI